MSLEKRSFYVAFVSPACLSLSLLFFSTCVYLGEAVVESPDPTRICEWAEGSFIYRRRPLQEGGVASSIYSSEVHQWEGTTSSGGKPQNDVCWQRHGASSLVWLVGTVSGPYPFALFLATDSRTSEGPAWSCPTSADNHLCGQS